MISRFRRAVRAARNATVESSDSANQTVAALVIGPGTGELAGATAWLRATSGRRCILITDTTAVEHFQLPGLVTEFLPTGRGVRGQDAMDPARTLYVQRRLTGIFTKWSVSRCVAIGPDAEALLDAVTAQALRGVPVLTRAIAPAV